VIRFQISNATALPMFVLGIHFGIKNCRDSLIDVWKSKKLLRLCFEKQRSFRGHLEAKDGRQWEATGAKPKSRALGSHRREASGGNGDGAGIEDNIMSI